MPLLRLPDDVLRVILDRLSSDDIFHVTAAFCGFRPSFNEQSHIHCIPMSVRWHWWMHSTVYNFRQLLHTTFADRALVHALFVPYVYVFVDWSPFSDTVPSPIAEYSWVQGPRANVVIHNDRIVETVEHALHKGTCIVHCGMYKSSLRPAMHITQEPIFLSHYMFAPNVNQSYVTKNT